MRLMKRWFFPLCLPLLSSDGGSCTITGGEGSGAGRVMGSDVTPTAVSDSEESNNKGDAWSPSRPTVNTEGTHLGYPVVSRAPMRDPSGPPVKTLSNSNGTV